MGAMAGFCPDDADVGIEISDGGACAAGKPDRPNMWLGVRGRPGVMYGAYQFDIELEQDCLLRVGWGADTSDRIIGLDALSFGYGGSARKSSNRKFDSYGEEYGAKGTIVSCLIDRRSPDRQAISYALNGTILGVAFELPPKMAGVPLFPAVSGKGAWCAVCHSAKLWFPNEGYQPLVEALALDDAVVGPLVLGLCSEDADPGVVVSADGFEAECKQAIGKNAWFGIRGRPGVLRGAYQYEVELCSKSLLRVGWGSLRTNRAIGNDVRSFGYGGTGKKSTGGNYEDYGECFQGAVGAVIACLIDRRDPQRQTISFCLDGKNLGVAFEIPVSLICDEPLFPALCGKGAWQVTCRYANFAFPIGDYRPLSQALAARDAVHGQGLPGTITPPAGARVVFSDAVSARQAQIKRRDPMQELRRLAEVSTTPVEGVVAGRHVVLHVHSGPWQGWYECEVVDTDPQGCYLKHVSDGYTENVPWAFLNGGKYSMELLAEECPSEGGQEQCVPTEVTGSTAPSGVSAIEFYDSPVPGLASWLNGSKLQLGGYVGRAIDWVDAQGAVSMEEVMENIIDFAGALGLKPIEQKRLLEWGPWTATLTSTDSCAAGALGAPAATDLMTSPATGKLPRQTRGGSRTELLRRGCLRVHADLGAGLTLVMCEVGYFVSKIEEPGQRDLRKGDAIVAIGEAILLGLAGEELEARFAKNFRDGVDLVKGNYLKLRQRPFGELREAIARLLSEPPLAPLVHIPLAEGEASATESGPGLLRSLTQTKSASGGGLLRRGRLCLDTNGQAGLELSTSEAGYLVDTILAEPGQPDLHAGDAIVAVGGSMLMGLEEEEVERRFGEAYCNGATIVAGPQAELLAWPFNYIHCEVERLMAPSCASAFVLERAKTY